MQNLLLTSQIKMPIRAAGNTRARRTELRGALREGDHVL